MCREFEELWEEIYNESRRIGKLEKAKEIAATLCEMGMEIEQIAEVIKFSPEDVQKWISETK